MGKYEISLVPMPRRLYCGCSLANLENDQWHSIGVPSLNLPDITLMTLFSLFPSMGTVALAFAFNGIKRLNEVITNQNFQIFSVRPTEEAKTF